MAFAAEPLGESPFSTLGGVIQIIIFYNVAFPFQSLAVAGFSVFGNTYNISAYTVIIFSFQRCKLSFASA